MANYKGHLVGGLVGFTAIIFLFSLYTGTDHIIFLWLACCLGGALFPDIDIKSKGQQLFYKIMVGVVLLCVLFNYIQVALILSVCSFTPLLVRHRGLFHKLWFLLLISVSGCYTLILFFPRYSELILSCTAFFALGIITHLWLDLGWKKMLSFR